MAAKLFIPALIALVILLPSGQARADALSARAAMENPANPLLLLSTSAGDIYLELLTAEAPANVENFLALARGGDGPPQGGYYDGMPFHRVIPGFVIQAGSPRLNPAGAPARLLADEINAASLGLDRMPVMDPAGNFNPVLNIGSRREFHESLLNPLYARLGINTEAQMLARQYEILAILGRLTVREAYENQGYRYTGTAPTRGVSRGVVALANAGPGQNGPEFFIALRDAPWLNGRHTVIGKVVEGMAVADAIGGTAVNRETLAGTPPAAQSLVYSLQRIN